LAISFIKPCEVTRPARSPFHQYGNLYGQSHRPNYTISHRLDSPHRPHLPSPLSPLTATGRTLSPTCRSRWTASP
jgi:hypothetical protein